MQPVGFVGDLGLALSVAAVTGLAARRLGQPAVLGYLLAGLVVGPYLPLPLFADPVRIQQLSDFGVVLVMFGIGLQFRVRRFVEVLPAAGLAGVIQMGAMAWLGVTAAARLGWSPVEGLFLAGSLAISSSTMVVSKVLDEHPVGEGVRRLVLGILVIQDLAAIGLVAAFSGLARGGDPSLLGLLRVELEVAGFLVAMAAGGMLVVPRLVRAAVACGSDEVVAVTAGGLCFGAAALAAGAGYSVALGAFVAGVLVAESGERRAVERLVTPLRDLFGAVFFVSVGMGVDPRLAAENAGLTFLVAGAVVLGQLVTVSVGGVLSGLPLPQAVTAGLALGQLGEFAFLLAAIGADAGILRPEFRPVVVSAAVLTAFTTPALVARADRVAAAASRVVPGWLRTATLVYQGWLDRVRLAPPAQRSPFWRGVGAVAIDGLLLVGGGLGALAWVRAGRPFWGAPAAAAGILAVPLAVGLVRNTRWLGDHLVTRVRDRAGGEAAAGVVRLMVALGVVAGVGLPAAALLRPALSGPYLSAGVAAAGAGLLAVLRRRAGDLDREVVAGAAAVLRRLAAESKEDREHVHAVSSDAPALGEILAVPLGADSPVLGRALGDVSLRALTGAMVLAIRRDGGDLIHPGPAEVYRVGDVVALMGPAEARTEAARRLTGEAGEARPA